MVVPMRHEKHMWSSGNTCNAQIGSIAVIVFGGGFFYIKLCVADSLPLGTAAAVGLAFFNVDGSQRA